MSYFWSKKSEANKNIPTIEHVLDEAEVNGKVGILGNQIPERLLKLRKSLGIIPPLEGRRHVHIEDIEVVSPLLAFEVKRRILAELVELGFDIVNYDDFEIRYGKKVSYNFYYINMKAQENIPDKKIVLIKDAPGLVKSPEIVEIKFASIVPIKGEEIVIYYPLILGVSGIEDVSND